MRKGESTLSPNERGPNSNLKVDELRCWFSSFLREAAFFRFSHFLPPYIPSFCKLQFDPESKSHSLKNYKTVGCHGEIGWNVTPLRPFRWLPKGALDSFFMFHFLTQ